MLYKHEFDYKCRTCADIDHAVVRRENETGLDPFDIQQFIGSLRTDHGRAGQIVSVEDRDRIACPVDLRMADGIRLRLIFCRIVPEDLPHAFFQCSSPYFTSLSVYFSFSVIFSFLAIFQVLQCAFLIFHVF